MLSEGQLASECNIAAQWLIEPTAFSRDTDDKVFNAAIKTNVMSDDSQTAISIPTLTTTITAGNINTW